MVWHGVKKRQRALGVLHGVKRIEWRAVQAQRLPAIAAAVDEIRIAFLDVRRIAQHPIAKVDGGRGGVDRAGESVLDHRRQIAAVVDMRVRKDDGVDGGSVEGQMAVLLVRLFAPALIETAIEQNPLAAGLYQVHGPGDSPGGAPKRYFHYPSESVMVSEELLAHDLKVIGHRKYVGDGICADFGEVLIGRVVDDAHQGHLAVLHNDVDGRHRLHGVPV